MNSLQAITLNKSLKQEIGDVSTLSVKVISNWSSQVFASNFENAFLLAGFKPDIEFIFSNTLMSGFDKVGPQDVVVILFDIGLLKPDLHLRGANIDAREEKELVQLGGNIINLINEKLGGCKAVVMTNFCAELYTSVFKEYAQCLDRVAEILNGKLSSSGIHAVDLRKHIFDIGVTQAKNQRDLYTKLIPYTPIVVSKICHSIEVKFKKIHGSLIKLIILDCDNTLWHGVVGEDLPSGIRYRPSDGSHSVFNEFHNLLLSLKSKGVLLALCTKNNKSDIDAVLTDPNFPFTDDDFVSIKANWSPKHENVKEMISELNLGSDAVLFIDDSPMELESCKNFIPELRCLEVTQPTTQFVEQFKNLFNEISPLNYSEGADVATKRYKVEAERRQLKTSQTWEDYLKSLDVKVSFCRNEEVDLRRCAEMTRKTNQFNFQTVRRTESEYAQLLTSKKLDLIQISVADNFGDYGITGLLELRESNSVLYVDQFLLSCRVLGRGVEQSIFEFLEEELKARPVNALIVNFVESTRNQVAKEAVFKFLNIDENALIKNLEIKYETRAKGWTYRLR